MIILAAIGIAFSLLVVQLDDRGRAWWWRREMAHVEHCARCMSEHLAAMAAFVEMAEALRQMSRAIGRELAPVIEGLALSLRGVAE